MANRDVYHAELEAIRALLPPPQSTPPAQGLEVGIGSGKFSVPLGITVGVEPAAAMAAKAEQQGLQVVRGVAEDLPFVDATFDFVLMVTTICFVDDILKSFQEALRVLKPGGSIIVGFVDKESDLGRQYHANRHSSVFYREATFFSTPEVCTHLAAAGFGEFTFRQTLIPDGAMETIKDGFGKGAFVVIKAVKPP